MHNATLAIVLLVLAAYSVGVWTGITIYRRYARWLVMQLRRP